SLREIGSQMARTGVASQPVFMRYKLLEIVRHTLSGRSRLAGSVSPIPGLSQLCVASCESAPATRRTACHQRPWLGEAVAAVHTGDGGGCDRSRLVTERGAALSGATMAAASGPTSCMRGR